MHTCALYIVMILCCLVPHSVLYPRLPSQIGLAALGRARMEKALACDTVLVRQETWVASSPHPNSCADNNEHSMAPLPLDTGTDCLGTRLGSN